MQVTELRLSDISADPNQPRKHFDPDELNGLADSIREHGVISPIVVRPVGAAYLIVAGERRWRASRIAELTTIPAIIRFDLTPARHEEVATLENIARSPLNPLEEARAFQNLRERGKQDSDIGRIVGKSTTYVAHRVQLLDLLPPFQQLVAYGQMTTTAGEAIARLDPDDQHVAVRAMVEQGLGNAAIGGFVELLLLKRSQTALFGDEEVPERKREVRDVRARFERAVDKAVDALNALTDPRTRALMPEAIAGDTSMVLEKLALLEACARSFRRQLEGAEAVRRTGLWQ